MDPLFADIGNSTIKIARLVNGSVDRLSYTDHQNAPKDLLSSVSLLSNVGMSLAEQQARFGDCASVHDLLDRLPLNLAYNHPKQLARYEHLMCSDSTSRRQSEPEYFSDTSCFELLQFFTCNTRPLFYVFSSPPKLLP